LECSVTWSVWDTFTSGERAGKVGGLECVGHFYEWGKGWKCGWSGVCGTLLRVGKKLERWVVWGVWDTCASRGKAGEVCVVASVLQL